eukprot:1324916-Amorphochlora_amoeboformis.AAC.1
MTVTTCHRNLPLGTYPSEPRKSSQNSRNPPCMDVLTVARWRARPLREYSRRVTAELARPCSLMGTNWPRTRET